MGSHFTEEEAHMSNKHMKQMLNLIGNKKVINQDENNILIDIYLINKM